MSFNGKVVKKIEVEGENRKVHVDGIQGVTMLVSLRFSFYWRIVWCLLTTLQWSIQCSSQGKGSENQTLMLLW